MLPFDFYLTASWQNFGEWEGVALTGRKRQIIDALQKWGDLSITGLATHTAIAKSHISDLVSELITDGKVKASKDGRNKVVSLIE